MVLELTIITDLTNLFSINFHFYWLKIAQIGNYCQLKAACCQTNIIGRIRINFRDRRF